MRRSARRAGAVAVIAAGALLVGGCGSGDDGGSGNDDAGGGKPQASASTSDSSSEGASGKPSGEDSGGDSEGASGDGKGSGSEGSGGSDGSGGEDGSGESGKLAGVWKAKGKQVVLTFVGDSVTLLREEGRNCTGSLSGNGGRTVALKCPGGADETRTNGTIGALKAKSLKVSWKGGPTEVYARVSDVPVKLPEEQ